MDSNVIFLIKKYLVDRGVVNADIDDNAVVQRQRGKSFSFEEHLRALIYALLTNQRRWSDVEPHLPEIDRLFFGYDVAKVNTCTGDYFEQGIRDLRCGNRNIHNQMQSLHENIKTLRVIENQYGSLDRYVTSKSPDEVVVDIANGRYKLHTVGTALAWEYLRNVGIDGAKPDLHLKRFMGSDRMGVSRSLEASDNEVITEIKLLSDATGLTRFEIDFIIWCFCADSKGEVCTANPRCNICPVSQYCRIK